MGNQVSQNDIQSPSNDYRYRFLSINKEPLMKFASIDEYKKLPQVSLDQAVSSLVRFVPKIKQMVQLVKVKCTNPVDNLTIDESASIMLYTLEWNPVEESFYVILNKTLRDKKSSQFNQMVLLFKTFHHSTIKNSFH